MLNERSGDEVVFHVESDQFTVKRNLLRYYSPYFQDALKDDDGDPNRILEVTVKVSRRAVQMSNDWLRHGKLRIWDDRPCTTKELMEIYIFAYRCDIPAIRDQVINTMVVSRHRGDVHYNPFTMDDVQFAFAELPASSELCQYIITSFVHHFKPETDIERLFATLPTKFLAAMTVRETARCLKAMCGESVLPCPCGELDFAASLHETLSIEPRFVDDLSMVSEKLLTIEHIQSIENTENPT